MKYLLVVMKLTNSKFLASGFSGTNDMNIYVFALIEATSVQMHVTVLV